MNHPHVPNPDEGSLSSYLAGEMPDEQVAAFEEQLAADPGMRARLDALAQALASLGGVDDVDPPVGFDQRLRERLSA
ncbi:MAG: hypothetical protein GEU74_00290, partial [Nitriliruptorales bacterium]|nr:hypothetical protein [Nitriliruptorales bacterium]